jgi:YesN/AraC family two-component response regulator
MEQTSANPAPPPPKGRILFADDDRALQQSVLKWLTREGFICDIAGNARDALALLKKNDYDVLLSDINMPDSTGLDLLESLPPELEGLPTIFLTGNPTIETATRSVRLRVMAYLTKPPDYDELLGLLQQATGERQEMRVLKESRQRIQDWDREIARLQRLLAQAPGAERQSAMQSYLRLSLRNLVVGLVELEHLLIHRGGQLGADEAVEKQELLHAVRKTIGVLNKTKDHFKSKELGELRKELETLLGN